MAAITSTPVTPGTDILSSQYNTLRTEVLSSRPIGQIELWGTNSAPDDFLLCQGQAVSRSTYSALFAIISTTYGTGDGSTTFNLPNLQGKVPVGRNSSDTDFDTLGETGGAKTHTLTEAQMPVHTHGVNDGGHNHSLNNPSHSHSVSDPGHRHTIAFAVNNNKNYSGTGRNPIEADNPTNNNTSTVTTGISVAAATTSVSANAAATGITIQNAGAGSAHNNVQPYIVLNYMIRYQ